MTIGLSHYLTVAAILVQFLWYAPVVRATTEEAWAARADVGFARMLASSTEEPEVRDPWVTRMRSLPATVVSTTLEGSLDWPDANVVRGDAVDVVARLKEESEVPLRSHGSLSTNRALMAAGGRPRPGDTFPRHHRSDR